ncbi:MAG: hypothetical protein JO250_16460 [Armatimonadetes bacterium]|nr:hypothetical protein [Armatimonadota bacterium]
MLRRIKPANEFAAGWRFAPGVRLRGQKRDLSCLRAGGDSASSPGAANSFAGSYPAGTCLTIGDLSVTFAFDGDAASVAAWDEVHRPFITTSPAGTGGCLAARLRVRPGVAAPASHPELLADGRLWMLRRDPATGARRLAVHGCPVGDLAMTLDLDPPGDGPLTGDLFLGPPPAGQARVPLGYPLTPLLWTLLLGRLGPGDAGLLCHACGVVTPTGEGLLFTGFSGAGKSTTSRLWRAACPDAAVLSDDRVVLRRDPSSPTGFTIHGTPWHGDAEEVSTGWAPLRRLLLLGRSPDGVTSRLVPLAPAAAAAQLLARTTPPIWDAAGTVAALGLAAAVCQSRPVARWDFAPGPQAVHDLLTE